MEISWSEVLYPASLLKNSNLTEVTLYLSTQKSISSPPLFRYKSCIQDYISAGYKPKHVNIVPCTKSGFFSVKYLLTWWADHSTRDQYRPPDGYTAHLKLYSDYRVPFNLSPTVPQFHIQFALTPSVIVSRCNYYTVLGQNYYTLKLHHCNCSDRSCNCIVLGASVNESVISHYNVVPRDGYRFDVCMPGYVVKWYVNDMKSLLDKDLEQLSSLIPNLQRLDLMHCNVSKDNLRGLSAVANNCRNLKGLKLTDIRATSLNLMVFWEILSGMRLTHMSIEYCVIISANQREMVNLCSTLQAIEIGFFSICEACNSSSSEGLLCLSQFSSLQYCRVCHYNPNVVQDIVISCKKLKCLIIQPNRIYKRSRSGISLSSTCNNKLEQLYIDLKHAIVSDKFMESVSAHGGLTHVCVKVATMTEKGVSILIENSPKLIQLTISLSTSENGGFDPSTLEISNFTLHFNKTTLMFSLVSNTLEFRNPDFFRLW